MSKATYRSSVLRIILVLANDVEQLAKSSHGIDHRQRRNDQSDAKGPDITGAHLLALKRQDKHDHSHEAHEYGKDPVHFFVGGKDVLWHLALGALLIVGSHNHPPCFCFAEL